MKTIGIYPGSFQPATRAHLDVYNHLKSTIGNVEDVFVATTDRVPTPEAPLNFGDKQQIWVRHGIPASHIVKVSSLPLDHKDWRPREIYNKFSDKRTVAIIVLNKVMISSFAKRKEKIPVELTEIEEILRELGGKETDQQKKQNRKSNTRLPEDPYDPDVLFAKKVKQAEKEAWLKPDGSPQYFQPYKGNENILTPCSEHAYILVEDDTKIQGKPISTTNIRYVLGSPKYEEDQKKKFFKWVFGWFDEGLYKLMAMKFKNAHLVSY